MRLLKLAVLLLLASVISGAQAKIPDTPAGQQLSAWLENFNKADRDAYKSFLDKNYPSGADDLDRDMRFRQMTGGFEIKKVKDSTPTKIDVFVQERASDQFALLTL